MPLRSFSHEVATLVSRRISREPTRPLGSYTACIPKLSGASCPTPSAKPAVEPGNLLRAAGLAAGAAGGAGATPTARATLRCSVAPAVDLADHQDSSPHPGLELSCNIHGQNREHKHHTGEDEGHRQIVDRGHDQGEYRPSYEPQWCENENGHYLGNSVRPPRTPQLPQAQRRENAHNDSTQQTKQRPEFWVFAEQARDEENIQRQGGVDHQDSDGIPDPLQLRSRPPRGCRGCSPLRHPAHRLRRGEVGSTSSVATK